MVSEFEDVELEADSETIDELEDEIDTGEQDDLSGTKFKIIALDDLSQEQVKVFATERKVDDVAMFLKEIERVEHGRQPHVRRIWMTLLPYGETRGRSAMNSKSCRTVLIAA